LAGRSNQKRIFAVAQQLLNGGNVEAIDWELAHSFSISYSAEASWRIIANAFMFLRHLEENHDS